MRIEESYNYIQVDERISTAGMPQAAHLQDAARQGFKSVINLATYNPEHSLADEAGLAQALGLGYFHIPVAWDEPRESDFAAFVRVMDERLAAGERVLVHCAANFRASAFFGLYAQKRLGWEAQRAEAFRAAIWQGSDYPIWEEFILRIRKSFDSSEIR